MRFHISFARHRVEESSVINILSLQIDAIATPMARITQRSCEQLQLAEGQ
jgi:hypothetical protein